MNKLATHSAIQASKSASPSRVQQRLKKIISLKTSDFILGSSSQMDRNKRKEENSKITLQVQQKLKKAKELCKSVKCKNINQKTLSENNETACSLLDCFRKNGKILSNQLIDKKSCPQHLSILASSPKHIDKSSNDSPKKGNSVQKRKMKSLLFCQENNNLQQIREIQSFMMDDQNQISIVEGHGSDILDWGVCMGKATQFRILKFLDQGKFGKVYLAQSHRNHMIYSVKSIYRSTMDDSTMHQLIREVKIQGFLNHPNIVKIYNFFVDDDSAYLVLQPCLGKNLYQNLKQMGRVPQKIVKQWIRQVCTAVQFMHSNDVIHRDLKPQNILLHQNMIKICDFGWAVHSPLLRNTQCGTPLYTPPEVVNRNPYDSKIDIWSIGILTYQLLYGTIPFQIRHVDDMIKIIEQEVYFSNEIYVSQAAKDFMVCCLHKNPIERSSIRQLLEHQFLNRIQKFRATII